MSIDNNKHLVGQPTLKQMLDRLPKEKFMQLVHNLGTDRYYKTFFSWDQLILMLFGIFSRCDSMGEICDGLRVMGGNLNYFGMDCSPAKSTAGDALRDRPSELFRQFYFVLYEHFYPTLSVSRKQKYRKLGVSFEEFFALDSTTVPLFSDIMKGIGRNPKGDGKRKGGLKVHMLTDVHADTPQFIQITEARVHDKNFLQYITLPCGSMAVCDKAYIFYSQFAKWTEEGVNFVCRLKENAKYVVQGEIIFEKCLEKDDFGVFKVEHIHVDYAEQVEVIYSDKKTVQKTGNTKTLCLRLVFYKDEQGRTYKFITNNWSIKPEEVALIYKYRWSIETTFKKLKQNFQLTYFYSDTENGIKTQIWCTLIAYLLLQIVQTISESNKALSTIATLIRMFLSSHNDVVWIVKEGRRTYTKSPRKRNKSPAISQMQLF